MTTTDSSRVAVGGRGPSSRPLRGSRRRRARTGRWIALRSASSSRRRRPEPRPRATRVAEGAWLGGVCTGLARHLGWPVMVIRIAFVALMTFQFIGVIAYGALWLLMPPEPRCDAPGLE